MPSSWKIHGDLQTGCPAASGENAGNGSTQIPKTIDGAGVLRCPFIPSLDFFDRWRRFLRLTAVAAVGEELRLELGKLVSNGHTDSKADT